MRIILWVTPFLLSNSQIEFRFIVSKAFLKSNNIESGERHSSNYASMMLLLTKQTRFNGGEIQSQERAR